MTKPLLDQILDSWDFDAKMDSSEPGIELLRIPVLHAKYLRLHSDCSLRVKKLDLDMASLIRVKLDYYQGRMSQEELNDRGWAPFKFILKSEVHEYVAADPEIIALESVKANYQECVNLLNSILKELNSRTYQLRSYIDFQKFLVGQ